MGVRQLLAHPFRVIPTIHLNAPNTPGEYQALGLVKVVWFPKENNQQRANFCL